MSFVRCKLPHFIHLVLPEKCLTTAARSYPGLSFPKTLTEVEDDFLAYAESGLITLIDEKQPEKLRISFCTSQYELVCALTQQQDAYFGLSMSPISLRTHNQIVNGAVRIIPQAWGLFEDLQDFNNQVNSRASAGLPKLGQTGLEAILSAWKLARQPALGEPQSDRGSSADELAFMANIDTLIELACQVELEQAARQERIHVKSVEQVPVTRAVGTAYRFLLITPATLRVGEYLQAGAGETGPRYDGVVVESTGSSLVLRFPKTVELKTLQRTDWLIPKVSTRQYTIQHAAVNALRNNEALNPGLLALLVENRFESFAVPAITDATGKPNLAQKTMIERALLVPDMLLALGPPGTGKTDTIREIAARQAAQGKKVLVTSKNNKAVDNVLEGLDNIHALRIGREEAVTPAVRPLLIDNKAIAMQQDILTRIQMVQQGLDGAQTGWPAIQALIAQLTQQAADWQQAQVRLDGDLDALEKWQRAAHSQVESILDRQKQHARLVSTRLNLAIHQAQKLRPHLDAMQKRSRIPLLGAVFVLLADQLARNWQITAQQYENALQALRQSSKSLIRIWEGYRHFVTVSPQALSLKQVVLQGEETLMKIRTGIVSTLVDLSRITESLDGTPALPKSADTPEALKAALEDWPQWLELMAQRQILLQDWRDLLHNRPQALFPALIRGADVVGATCIGIATDMRFEDLDFDLVIADEAGQIQVMDLLVPLVRAHRAVLVGDHLQLPPLVDPEITIKIRENEPENQELGEWLEKSLFERLIERPTTPTGNTVMLNTQYRMPAQIADFISLQFYNGNYHTGHKNPHTDVFFAGSPIVFVDTMREFRHFEQRSEDGEGYSNSREASLICDLLLAYQTRGVEAGVIVPYKKQAEVIRRLLRNSKTGLTEDALISRVATVDSFQGREQDVIIFGFTRSNTEGRIGFLTELRRLNVSLTRARQQLILVGDSSTLTSTPDTNFANLMKNLLETVKKTPEGYVYANELSRHIQP